MDYSKKIIPEIPIKCLWNNQGVIGYNREKSLYKSDIVKILKEQKIEFVIADVGVNFEWIKVDSCFEFWKIELKNHLIDDENYIKIENYIGQYAYIASLWRNESQNILVLLEKYH